MFLGHPVLKKITICLQIILNKIYNLFTKNAKQDYNFFTNNNEQDNSLFTNDIEPPDCAYAHLYRLAGLKGPGTPCYGFMKGFLTAI